MEIQNVKVEKGKNSLAGRCDFVFSYMTVRGCAIMKSDKSSGYYVLFPRRKSENGEYKNVWELKKGHEKADKLYRKMCQLANQAMKDMASDDAEEDEYLVID